MTVTPEQERAARSLGEIWPECRFFVVGAGALVWLGRLPPGRQTLEELDKLVGEMGEEDPRAGREGLDEENLAVFDVLVASKGDALDTRTCNRVKEVARELLDKVKSELAELDHWKEKRQTQAQVRQLIYDYLCSDETGLPMDAHTDDEVKELAEVVYLHVYEQYETAANSACSTAGNGVPA